ncbi:uncharacterized protein BDZ99DRAFT_461103 [Mytilinidion resinicola]|uniref:Uncharacterized protein n=1 Tax=Mytilinidion resinicola TaxID=574789 RepID=A0A6A6YUD5_9PEZI|nr:uncharacterized protein BDZ99DRAFT_461103 [Mytilinidion resinicola]KAF2812391.1 hypothetical protein BDZ99DRAFT_461103 [Mytilinidion resinicola]
MAPPIEIFSSNDLAEKVQYTASGKRRKPDVDLRACKLLEMVQYHCTHKGDYKKDPRAVYVECSPLVRSFRRCADGLTVETTAWEDEEGN